MRQLTQSSEPQSPDGASSTGQAAGSALTVISALSLIWRKTGFYLSAILGLPLLFVLGMNVGAQVRRARALRQGFASGYAAASQNAAYRGRDWAVDIAATERLRRAGITLDMRDGETAWVVVRVDWTPAPRNAVTTLAPHETELAYDVLARVRRGEWMYLDASGKLYFSRE